MKNLDEIRAQIGPCFNCWSEDDGEMLTGEIVDVCNHGHVYPDGTPHLCLVSIECERCGVRGPAAFLEQNPAALWNSLYQRMPRGPRETETTK